MLAADKLLLQSNVKQRSIELREKELKLFNQNFSAICTQSAIMAGFTLTTFVEIDLPPEKKLAKVQPGARPRHTACLCGPSPLTGPALRCADDAALLRDLLHLRQLHLRSYGHLCERLGRRQGAARRGWIDGLRR